MGIYQQLRTEAAEEWKRPVWLGSSESAERRFMPICMLSPPTITNAHFRRSGCGRFHLRTEREKLGCATASRISPELELLRRECSSAIRRLIAISSNDRSLVFFMANTTCGRVQCGSLNARGASGLRILSGRSTRYRIGLANTAR